MMHKERCDLSSVAMKAAGELIKIMHVQSELNSVDVGEKYETASKYACCEQLSKEVAPDANMETVLQNYRKVKSGQEDMPQELTDQKNKGY